MAVTVVRGFVGKTDPDGGSGRQAKANPSNNSALSSQAQSNLGSAVARSTEAVVSAIRITKFGASGEKLRALQDAEKLSDEVAGRIARDEEPASNAHADLSPNTAREHFA